MPEERRNPPRRRIAGQRRTSDRREALPDETTSAESADATTRGEERADATTRGEEGAEATTRDAGASHAAPSPSRVDASDSSSRVDASDRAGRAAGVRLMVGVLAVLVVLTLTAAVVLGERAWRGRQAEQARSEASTAARRAAELVLSYDHRTLTKDFEASRATLTPEFAADFDQTTKVVAEQATNVKATVRAEVREVGVRDGDADRVTLLVFVNQTTTSTITQNKPRVDLNRARFTMVRIGGQWLVRSIEPL